MASFGHGLRFKLCGFKKERLRPSALFELVGEKVEHLLPGFKGIFG